MSFCYIRIDGYVIYTEKIFGKALEIETGTNMRYLYYIVTKPFWDLLFSMKLMSKMSYQQKMKLYYHYKTTFVVGLHNFLAKGKVKRYFKQHTNDAKMVIYTCLTGGYDALIFHDYLNPECDYICFTDDENMIAQGVIGQWKIMPLRFSEMNNSKNNRWHKMHPHLLFPNYQTSLYIDANVNFKTEKVFEYISKLPLECYIAVPRHASRDCIYDEAKFVMENNIDTPESVLPLLEKYHEEGFPEHFGMGENNVIFRKHNDTACIKLMNDWWKIFNDYSKRDQLTLFYLFWKENIDFAFFAPSSFKKDHKNFRIYKHKR